MSEEAPKDAAPKKGLPIKTIATVAVLLIVEAVVIVGIVTMFGKPSDVKGVEVEHGHIDEGEQTVEIPLLKEKFTNGSSGRMWIWDTEIIVTAKLKHAGEPPRQRLIVKADEEVGAALVVGFFQTIAGGGGVFRVLGGAQFFDVELDVADDRFLLVIRQSLGRAYDAGRNASRIFLRKRCRTQHHRQTQNSHHWTLGHGDQSPAVWVRCRVNTGAARDRKHAGQLRRRKLTGAGNRVKYDSWKSSDRQRRVPRAACPEIHRVSMLRHPRVGGADHRRHRQVAGPEHRQAHRLHP